MNRYFLISSLPLLNLGQAPRITAEGFLAVCREQLGDGANMGAVEALMTSKPSTHPFVTAWRNKDTALRNAIVKARADNADPAQWLRPVLGDDDSEIERLVEEAFRQSDPLRQENALDKARWILVEGLQGLDPTDIKVVLAYAVKLSLALRWAALDAERGRETFNTLTQLPDGLITL